MIANEFRSTRCDLILYCKWEWTLILPGEYNRFCWFLTVFHELRSKLFEANVKCSSELLWPNQFSPGHSYDSVIFDLIWQWNTWLKLAKNTTHSTVAWPSVWAFSTEFVFMFHLLQIIAVFVGFLAYIIDLNVCPKCIFPLDGVRLNRTWFPSSPSVQHDTCSHFAIPPSSCLCLLPGVFCLSLCPSFTWSISGLIERHLCCGNRWRIWRTRGCDSRNILFVQF